MKKINLKNQDSEVYEILKAEENKQQYKLSMIPSENFTSKAIREVVGSVFMNKYSEGYSAARYYEGNYNIDELEDLACERASELFELPKDWRVNVQPLSGSPANLAVYFALLDPGDKIMSMYLPDGGHLSHGWSYGKGKSVSEGLIYRGGKRKVSVVSRVWNIVQYKTDSDTHLFDYEALEEIAVREKPRLIITGGTAYPREIDYKKMASIANRVGAYYMADIAHEAGLIATGVNKSPVGLADVVTMTTHKTLRCNRGAMILSNKVLMKKINRAVFPGLQGGPHNHSIAGIAVGLKEAMKPEFRAYCVKIVKNAQKLATELKKYKFNLVSGGTDKHLILIDLTNKGVFGKKYARALDYAGIIANKNSMPGEDRSPSDPSALRMGTPWVTTRGMGEKEMELVAKWMDKVMKICQDVGYKDLDFSKFDKKVDDDERILAIADEVKGLCLKFPLDI